MKKLKVVDASPGAGGMLKGFLDSGRFEVGAYCAEIGSDSEETLVANLPSFKQKSSCDVLVGSFYDPSLVDGQYYRDRMREFRPAVSLVELPASAYKWSNPPGSCFGYLHEWYVLDAVDYLVPQHRKRCWVISVDRGLVGPNFTIGFPQPRNHPHAVKDAIGDITEEPKYLDWNSKTYNSGMDLHLAKRIGIMTRARFDSIPPGSSADAIPVDLRANYRQEDIGPSDVFGRLMWDFPAGEILPKLDPNKGRFIHPEWHAVGNQSNKNRVLSMLEAARIQTFPDGYQWYGSPESVMQQIGTATPVRQAMCWSHYVADLLDTD